MLATAIVLLFGSKYLSRKKLIKYVIVCLMASLFHASSILYIIYYFVFNFDFGTIGRRIVFLVSPIVIIEASNIISIVSNRMTQYSNYATYGSWYTWKVFLVPVTITVFVVLSIYFLHLNRVYHTGLWAQTLWIWLLF